MNKNELLKQITDCGIVAVVRAETTEKALKIVEACAKAGIKAIEVTFTVPGASDVIKEISKIYDDKDIIIGAGTVLDSETARAAILSGAQFIVSPCLNTDVIKLCNTYQVPVMPGCMTITEVINAMNAGADICKIFPGELFGPKIIKAFKAPIPQAALMPTGGVSLDNVEEWIKAGAVAVGVGGSLTAGAKTGDYDSIISIGKQFVEKIKIARGK